MKVQENIGEDVWPGFGAFKTTVLYMTNKGQVLINAKTAPSEYKPYSGPAPVWSSASHFTLEKHAPDGSLFTDEEYNTSYMANAYSSAQTSGHFPYSVFFLDSLERFHSKDMKWSVEEWMEVFWHEVFHNFQDALYTEKSLNTSMTNFAGVGPLIEDQRYLALVEKEISLIAKALQIQDQNLKLKIFCEQAIPARNRRAEYLKKKGTTASTDIERFYEVSEGTARYVEEMMALKAIQLDKVSMAKATASITGDPGFSRFAHSKKKSLDALIERVGKLRKGDRFYYQTGFALALLLDQLRPTWKKEVFSTPGFLDSLSRETCLARTR